MCEKEITKARVNQISSFLLIFVIFRLVKLLPTLCIRVASRASLNSKRLCQRHTIHDRKESSPGERKNAPRRWIVQLEKRSNTGYMCNVEQVAARRDRSSPQSSRTCLDAPCWLEVRAPRDATSSSVQLWVMLRDQRQVHRELPLPAAG